MEISKIVDAIAIAITNNKTLLNDLDQKIGDGDHGTNLDRGINAIKEKEADFATKSVDLILMDCAMALMSKVGGSSGPLLASLLIKMSQTLKNKPCDLVTLSEAFAAGAQAVADRGKSTVGEKTMNDVLIPVSKEFSKLSKTEKNPKIIFEKLADIAEKSAKATIPMVATKGRASYLGERSVGHMDPGAESCALIIKTIAEVL